MILSEKLRRIKIQKDLAKLAEDLTPYLISDAIYDVGWNGNTITAPSKNAIYDKIQTLGGGGDMLSTNNLSDVADVPTARINLGLDTTANQTDSADKRFMSDAQETKLDAISGTNTGDETAA